MHASQVSGALILQREPHGNHGFKLKDLRVKVNFKVEMKPFYFLQGLLLFHLKCVLAKSGDVKDQTGKQADN